MKNSLRMFIRESLMREAVGRDLFGLQTVSDIPISSERFEDSATQSIIGAAGTFFQAGKAFATAPRGNKIGAAGRVASSGNWRGTATGAVYILSLIVSSFGTRAGTNEKEKDDFANEMIEEFHKKLLENFKSNPGKDFSSALRYPPVVNDTAASNFYEESKIRPFRDHYESKLSSTLSSSTNYDTFFGQFSALSGASSATGALKTAVDQTVEEFANEKGGVLTDPKQKSEFKDALKKWAHYELVFLTAHEFMSSAMARDIDIILKNTTDESSDSRFEYAAEDMVNAVKSKIENSSTYKKSKEELNKAGYYLE